MVVVHSHKTVTFVQKASQKHNGKYSYENVEYVNSRRKIIINCKSHGDFEQSPNSHLRGQGCPKCGGSCPHTIESFIVEANKKHDGKFSYEKVKYVNNKTNITITCGIHGDFEQIPNSHLKGSGCSKCGGTCPYTTESFIVNANIRHDGKYSYEQVKYINAREKVIITCGSHGDFLQIPHSHLSGKGCRKCGWHL